MGRWAKWLDRGVRMVGSGGGWRGGEDGGEWW